MSDSRLIQHVNDYYAGLDEILQLRPVAYRFKPDTGLDPLTMHYGVVAQEAESVMPETVFKGPDRMGTVELDDMRHFDPSNLVFALVNAVRELKAEITALKRAKAPEKKASRIRDKVTKGTRP